MLLWGKLHFRGAEQTKPAGVNRGRNPRCRAPQRPRVEIPFTAKYYPQYWLRVVERLAMADLIRGAMALVLRTMEVQLPRRGIPKCNLGTSETTCVGGRGQRTVAARPCHCS